MIKSLLKKATFGSIHMIIGFLLGNIVDKIFFYIYERLTGSDRTCVVENKRIFTILLVVQIFTIISMILFIQSVMKNHEFFIAGIMSAQIFAAEFVSRLTGATDYTNRRRGYQLCK